MKAQYGGSARAVSLFWVSLSFNESDEGKNGERIVVPPLDCFPIPILLSTSRTSLGGAFPRLLLMRLRARGSGWVPFLSTRRIMLELRSRVELFIDAVASAGLEMLPLPSASRRSLTPTPPPVDLARLASDMFSMCISAGDSRRKGASPLKISWFEVDSTAVLVLEDRMVSAYGPTHSP